MQQMAARRPPSGCGPQALLLARRIPLGVCASLASPQRAWGPVHLIYWRALREKRNWNSYGRSPAGFLLPAASWRGAA